MTRAAVRCVIAALLAGGALAAPGCGADRTGAFNPAEVGPVPPAVTPPSQQAIRQAIDRGVTFLLRTQFKNGSWGSAHAKPTTVLAPVPGAHRSFKVGTTSLCIMALLETAGEEPEAQAALDRAEKWLIATLPKLRRDDPRTLYNIWGHALAIQAMVETLARRELSAGRRHMLHQRIDLQIHMLGRYQSLMGGWGYYPSSYLSSRPNNIPTSFTTATALIALHHAKEAGFTVPRRLPLLGLRTLRHARQPNFAYTYHITPIPMVEAGLSKTPGSLGRSQSCNAALYLWGDKKTTPTIIKTWLNRLFARNGWLSRARKTNMPHESWFRIAGYFFYYGHYYASICIHLLPPEDRSPFQDQLANVLLPLQEKDGSWWDFPVFRYHQQYGTAFALMSLQRCLRPQPPQLPDPEAEVAAVQP